MAVSHVEGVAVRGIASAVPAHVVLNSEIGEAGDRDYVEKISGLVGVTERRSLPSGRLGSDLARSAAERLLEALEWSATDVDLLVVATQTPDRLFPGVSFVLHRELGL